MTRLRVLTAPASIGCHPITRQRSAITNRWSGRHEIFCGAEGIVQCFRLSSGGKLFTERLEGVSKLASPVATADVRVYFVSSGTSHIIEAGPELKILATNRLADGGNGSSPAVANGRIFVQYFEFLYCIGEKKGNVLLRPPAGR